MKRIGKRRYSALATIAAAAIAGYGLREQNARSGFVSRANDILPEVMKRQEEVMGLCFEHQPRLNVTTGTDQGRLAKETNVLGTYNPRTDTISINFENISYSPLDVGDVVLGRYHEGFFTLESILKHELGHAYTAERRWRLGTAYGFLPLEKDPRYVSLLRRLRTLSSWDSPMAVMFDPQEIDRVVKKFMARNIEEFTQFYLLKLINEGIGEYFMSNGAAEDNFRDEEWPPTILDIRAKEWRHILYDGGYHLVRLLMKAAGPEKAVDFLLTSPPYDVNLQHLPAYQSQALGALLRDGPT
jgi:hypothetical protein